MLRYSPLPRQHRLRPASQAGSFPSSPPLPLPPSLFSSALPHIPIARIFPKVMEQEELKHLAEACEWRQRPCLCYPLRRLFRHRSGQLTGTGPECPRVLAPQFGALIGCLTRPLKKPGCACGAVLAICARRFGHSLGAQS